MIFVPTRPTLFLTSLLVWPAMVSAQVADPTRPPDAATAQAAPGATPATGESGLQATIVRSGGKSAALINGQYVKVGDKYGERRVLSISDSVIVLKGESGRDVVKLIPSIDKQMVKPAKPAKPMTDKKKTGEGMPR